MGERCEQVRARERSKEPSLWKMRGPVEVGELRYTEGRHWLPDEGTSLDCDCALVSFSGM